MRKIILAAVVLMGSLSMNLSHAAAANCSPKPLTVTSRISGVLSSPASAQGIMQSSINRLKRKFEAAATKRYGAKYTHVARGTCTCSLKSKNARTGERVRLSCKLTAKACDHPYVFMSDFKCKFR